MKRGIHYIVAVYSGLRANQQLNQDLLDPLFLIKLQLDALKQFRVPDIKKVTFVISPSSRERDDAIVEFIESISKEFNDMEILSYVKPTNEYYSYGCWDHCMQKHLDDDLDFFLMEDDYLPACNNFYAPFQQQLDGKTAYVCQLFSTVKQLYSHAAISNGILSIDAAREHFDTFGNCISIPYMKNKSKYSQGVIAQMGFLEHFLKIGFRIKDVSAEYKQPFLQPNHTITNYGNRYGAILIQPYKCFLESKN